METIVLQFQTPQDLGLFRKSTSMEVVEVNIKELKLIGKFTKDEIARAMNYYGARVIDSSAR